jgi:hypothetical protein
LISKKSCNKIKHEDVEVSPLRNRRAEKKRLEKSGGAACC